MAAPEARIRYFFIRFAVLACLLIGVISQAHANPECAEGNEVLAQAPDLVLGNIERAVLAAKNDYDPDDRDYSLDYDDSVLSQVSAVDSGKLLSWLRETMSNPNVAVREAALAVASRLGEPGSQLIIEVSREIGNAPGTQAALIRSNLAELTLDAPKKGPPYLSAADATEILKNIFPRLGSDDRFYVVSNLESTYESDAKHGMDTLDFYENVAMRDPQVNQKKAALGAVADLGPAALPIFKMGMEDRETRASDTCDVHSFAVELAPNVLGPAAIETLIGQYDTLHGCDQVRASTMTAAAQTIADMGKSGQAPAPDQLQEIQRILSQGIDDHSAADSSGDSSVVRMAAVEGTARLAQDPRVGWNLMGPLLVRALRDPANQDSGNGGPQTYPGEQILLSAAHAADYAGPAGLAVCRAAMDPREPQEVQQVGRHGCTGR